MTVRACTVSFVERGKRHEAKVDAETAYEAAVLALKQFQSSRYIHGPSRHAVLEIEVVAPKRIQLKVGDALTWLYGPGATDHENARKSRLRGLLADDRH